MSEYLHYATDPMDPHLKQRVVASLAALATDSDFRAVREGLLDPSVEANDVATRLADYTDPDIPKRSGASLAILEFLNLVDAAGKKKAS